MHADAADYMKLNRLRKAKRTRNAQAFPDPLPRSGGFPWGTQAGFGTVRVGAALDAPFACSQCCDFQPLFLIGWLNLLRMAG